MNNQLSDMTKRINEIEERIRNQEIRVSDRMAVFDLDNTLIIHDIGEAVFARLKQAENNGPLTVDGHPLPFSWSQYQNMIKRGEKRKAYIKLVTAMAGMPLETLIHTTRDILQSRRRSLNIGGQSIPIPRVNRTMHSLIRMLKKMQYRIFIISASNQPSVRLTARTLFQVAPSCAFGINPQIIIRSSPPGGKRIRLLSATLEEPIPFSRGKVSTFKKFIESPKPLITAGDSETDIHLLNLTHHKGLTIWVGNDPDQYRMMRNRAKHPETYFFLRQERAVNPPGNGIREPV